MNHETTETVASESAADLKDKCGSELNAQRFKMLEDISKELAGDVTFPTCFDVVIHLRKAIQDPNHTIDQIATMISLEPLISSKVLRIANSVAYNPSGGEVRDLKAAINRLGLNVVRSSAMATAMKQLVLSKNMEGFEAMNRQLWTHSVYSACAAAVIARHMTRLSPDEALLAGLVHDLGAFYMIYRAAQYEELRIRPDTVKHLVFQWHESIGHSLLAALGLPEDIVESSYDHDHLREVPAKPRTLRDVVYVANLLAGGMFDAYALDEPLAGLPAIDEQYRVFDEEIRAKAAEMMGNFG